MRTSHPLPNAPKPQPIRLPSTAQIDARIRRQTLAYARWRQQYLRLKDDGGRTHAGPRPVKPPPFVTTSYTEGTRDLVFTRPPCRREKKWLDERVEPLGVIWTVPCVGVHPIHGPCYYLDSMMVLRKQLLRTIPSRNLLVVRGPNPLTFKAIQQEWVRYPMPGYAAIRGKDPKKSVVGLHRWLCYVVR
jgi:hypothetical protein